MPPGLRPRGLRPSRPPPQSGHAVDQLKIHGASEYGGRGDPPARHDTRNFPDGSSPKSSGAGGRPKSFSTCRPALHFLQQGMSPHFRHSASAHNLGNFVESSLEADLPPFNGTTQRERIWGQSHQMRAFNATRKGKSGLSRSSPMLREVEVDAGRGRTVAEAVQKIGVTEQMYSRNKRKSTAASGKTRVQAAEEPREGEQPIEVVAGWRRHPQATRRWIRDPADGRPVQDQRRPGPGGARPWRGVWN